MPFLDIGETGDSPIQTPLRNEMKPNETNSSCNSATQDASQLEKASPKHSHHSTAQRFHGPWQDDSTIAVFWGLRTVLARFLLWINMPLTWIVGAAFHTRRVDEWLHDSMAWLGAYVSVPSELVMACVFVGGYVLWTLLSHTVFVFGALAYELWWNPYARAPSLKGKVGAEEEGAMLRSNRQIVRRVWRTLSFWKRPSQCTG